MSDWYSQLTNGTNYFKAGLMYLRLALNSVYSLGEPVTLTLLLLGTVDICQHAQSCVVLSIKLRVSHVRQAPYQLGYLFSITESFHICSEFMLLVLKVPPSSERCTPGATGVKSWFWQSTQRLSWAILGSLAADNVNNVTYDALLLIPLLAPSLLS